MANLKRLATTEDNVITVNAPISAKEIEDREKQYNLLIPKQFASRYNDMVFRPVNFDLDGNTYTIQYNHCTEPFCKWFGKDQEKFPKVKGQKKATSRYKLVGSKEGKSVHCNPNPNQKNNPSFNHQAKPYSNWSIAKEIERLVRIETIKDVEPDYQFHKGDCLNNGLTPFDSPKSFYKQGKTKNNAQRWQCKVCKKKTSILPNQRQSSTYGQKKNDILPMFAKLLLNKVPISRSCEILDIGVKTYYHKLEWLYRRCLEFLEKHERTAIEQKQFKKVWLNTDKLHYFLNNVRKKGQGRNKFSGLEDLSLPTYIVITSEVFSRYAFRSDVAYDWDISMEDLSLDTALYKDDHLNGFCRKNDRLDFPYYPQEPSDNDSQKGYEYREELKKIKNRSRYVDGLNVNSTYTTMAQYWIFKRLLKADEWRMISDDDKGITTAFNRVFSKEINLSDAHHFLCLTDRTKTKKQAEAEYVEAKQDLLDWGLHKGYDTQNLWTLARYYLTEVFQKHQFHENVSIGGFNYRQWANNSLEHPLASRDKGYHTVDCKTDLSSYEPEEIAKMILYVNDNAISSFMQQIRRRLSILERPIVSARSDGKSYIYANFNPKYAQYALTILRTYYNFCLPITMGDRKKLTPAQRLGIADRVFDLNDIIYLR